MRPLATRPAAVIFDLDGTLVDSAPAIRDIGSRFLGTLGAAPLTLEETRAFIGNGAEVFMDRCLAARGIAPGEGEHPALLARFLMLYDDAPPGDNHPYRGAAQMLAALAGAGMRLGICTNKPATPTLAVLSALGWERLFGAVVAGDTLAVKKPDPAPLVHAAGLLGTDAGAILYVGDSETDRDTALAAGAAFALWPHGYRKGPEADFAGALILRDWDDLTGIALAQPASG